MFLYTFKNNTADHKANVVHLTEVQASYKTLSWSFSYHDL